MLASLGIKMAFCIGHIARESQALGYNLVTFLYFSDKQAFIHPIWKSTSHMKRKEPGRLQIFFMVTSIARDSIAKSWEKESVSQGIYNQVSVKVYRPHTFRKHASS